MLVWTKLGPLWDGPTYLELIKSGKTLRGPRKSHACFSVSHMDPLIIRILIEIETPYYNHEDRDEHQHLGPFPQTFRPNKKAKPLPRGPTMAGFQSGAWELLHCLLTSLILMRYDVSFFGVFVGAKYIASITELQSRKQSVNQIIIGCWGIEINNFAMVMCC